MHQSSKNTNDTWRLKACVALCGILASTSSLAGSMDARTLLEDSKLYFTAPLRWDTSDWAYFGGSLLLVGAAHEFDDDVRNHFVNEPHAAPPGKDPNSTQQALPTAALLAGTFMAAVLTEDSAGYEETWSMAEAGALSAVSALALKYAAGRERPNDTADVNSWFNSGDSF